MSIENTQFQAYHDGDFHLKVQTVQFERNYIFPSEGKAIDQFENKKQLYQLLNHALLLSSIAANLLTIWSTVQNFNDSGTLNTIQQIGILLVVDALCFSSSRGLRHHTQFSQQVLNFLESDYKPQKFGNEIEEF